MSVGMVSAFPRAATTRNLLAGFLLVTAVPVAALVWLGFRLADQDRQLARQREAEQRELAAGRIVSALEQALAATERTIADRSPAGTGAIRIHFRQGDIAVQPPGAVPYYPKPASLPEARPAAFQAAEDIEFRQADPARAIEALLPIVSSPDRAVRAGALLRLARNLRKAGRAGEALDAYGRLARLEGVALDGAPADLVARRARCALLQELGRTGEFDREWASLQSDLRQARWRLDRASFRHYAKDPPDGDRAALAGAVEWLWSQQAQLPDSGRSGVMLEGIPVVLLWHKNQAGLDALAALPGFQRAAWFSKLPSVPGSVTLSIAPGAGKAQFPAAATGLPWNLTLAGGPAEDELAARRRLLLAGLAALVCLLAAGVYFIVRALARESAAMRLQSDFVAAVSHEFRTPLTSMRQFTELLTQDQEPPPEKRRAFHQAQARATERLNRLVESLLDFGRMEAGQRPYQPLPVDAAGLVGDVVQEFRREAEPRGFSLEWSGHAPGLRINADPDALSRAVWNLLDNAAKYSGEARWIGVELECRDGQALIHVRDRGIGIPAGERKRIFHKFVRGAQARDNLIKGTGLGLAMVQHIVEAHRGAVAVDSEPGRGSTFTISIPVEG
jgi:signal transduction histidine kinase